jgi:2-polyprenyl-3-methyl-5-hydroxy-6-metoxy-1,4-benzoquinol methylase
MSLDETKLNSIVQKVIDDIGAAFHAPLVLIGEKLGLFKAMAGQGQVTSAQLAERTGTAERYIREWLPAMAAGGYVTFDPATQKYSLSDEQACAFADENSPVYLPGAFQAATAAIRSQEQIADAFRTGKGFGWEEHDQNLAEGGDRFYTPNYLTHLVQSWIPALDGVEDKLRQGASVADIGCGCGTSTIIMAQAFPHSTFHGSDPHEVSITAARRKAEEAKVSDRVQFEVASGTTFSGGNYDFVTAFDCLHDMGDPVAASTHVLRSLKSDGTWMIVEPFAGDRVEENLTPIGRLYYCASVLICVPCALQQEGGIALGGQAGETRLREVLHKGGFTRFRRVLETPINMVFEARP